MNAKRVVVPAGIVFLVVFGFVITSASAQSGGGETHGIQAGTNSPGPKKAEEQFKNIQVLKGISAEQVIPSMMFITASLGVQCDFCHVQGAFEKDDKKPKQTARKMMEMMFAINKDNFEGHRAVTCYSCHRGNTDPVATPVVMAEEPTTGKNEAKSIESGEAGATSGPSANQLFEKYLTAVGGEAAVEKVTSRVMKGTITF